MTISNKSEKNYRGKCLGSPVTSYGGVLVFNVTKRPEVHMVRASGKSHGMRAVCKLRCRVFTREVYYGYCLLRFRNEIAVIRDAVYTEQIN